MAVTFRQPVEALPRPPRAVSRTIRKIGLLGSHTASLADCPWEDPSWELWGHASSMAWYSRSPDRLFDLHPKSRWFRPEKKTRRYPEWLAKNTVPIYMQAKYPEVPASIAYPKDRILNEYGQPRPYFTNQVAWMIALALSEGVTHLGLWGISYAARSEYGIQRGCAEYWLGRAAQAGVHVVLPRQCSLLAEPKRLYGYDSHDERGELVPEYQVKEFPREIIPGKAGEGIRLVEPPDHIKAEMEAEEARHPRPEWARGNGKTFEIQGGLNG